MDSLDRTKASVISEARAIAGKCARPGWDCSGAEAIYKCVAIRAAAVIRALPKGCPLPELAPEPNGSISLDWIRSRHKILSLSVSRSNRLPYAWIDGTERGHAVSVFDGKNIPHDILERIKGS